MINMVEDQTMVVMVEMGEIIGVGEVGISRISI